MLKLTNARTLASFLSSEFSRVGKDTAIKICRKAGLKPSMKPQELDHIQVEKLYKSIQSTKLMAPPLNCLSPLGEELLRKGVEQIVKPEFIACVTRPTTVYRGNPFAVECCIAWGGELEKRTKEERQEGKVLRFANKVPLLYQASACAITKAVQQVNWRNYGIPMEGNMPSGPIMILVHVASVWIPYTSESKEAIASYPEIIKEIKLGLQECGRKIGAMIRRKRKIMEKRMRLNLFEKYAEEISLALSELTGEKKDKILKVLKNVIGGIDEIQGESKEEADRTGEESDRAG
jgi:DNA topoisomerase-6 subunit B